MRSFILSWILLQSFHGVTSAFRVSLSSRIPPPIRGDSGSKPCTSITTYLKSTAWEGSESSVSKRRGGERRAKTIRDRTPQEGISLVQDIVQAVADAGPRAGPTRTLQAYRAFTTTIRDFLPQLLPLPTRTSSGVSLPAILRTLFERMGATYIKLGQFIASSPTLFPAEFVIEFQKCLDQTEPVPWMTVKKTIENELGPISQTFSYVDPKPLASASIAQVHSARLRSTGEEVVIKVQKPNIDECLQADLSFLYVSARVLEFLQPDWERTSLSAVAGDIRASMLEELDFLKEARNTIEFRRFLQDNRLLQQATAPRVYLDYTTKKVMVLEKLDGVSLLDEKAVQRVTNDPERGVSTILTALNIWSMSVTSMPWFHADVHAGNLLLLKDGRVGFIDFGIVGRINEKVFRSVNELSTALALGDSMGMAQALCNMGATDEQVDIARFARDIERVMARMNTMQVDFTVNSNTDGTLAGRLDVDETEITNILLEFVEVTENNGLRLPREFGLLVKQSLYFDRYLKILAPNVDIMRDDRVMLGGISPREREAVNGSSVDQEVIDV